MKNKISNLVLGTAQFGMDYGIANKRGKVSKKEIFNILEFAWENGVHSFDTAPSYNSELILGDFIKANGISNDIKILTKLPKVKDNKKIKYSIRLSIENSLKNLGTQISVLFFHNPKDSKYINDNIRFFKKIVNDYYLKSLGVSVYGPQEVNNLGECSLDLAYQFPLNILDQRFLGIDMPIGKKYARSIFLQGILASPNFIREECPIELKEIHKKYHAHLLKHGIDPIEAAISFVADNKQVDHFLVGIDSLRQLKKILFLKLKDLSPFIDSIPLKLNSYYSDPRNW